VEADCKCGGRGGDGVRGNYRIMLVVVVVLGDDISGNNKIVVIMVEIK